MALAVVVCLGGLSRLAHGQPAGTTGTSTVQFELAQKFGKAEDNVLARMPIPAACKSSVSTFVGRNDPKQAPREMSKADVTCGPSTFSFVRDQVSVWLTCTGVSCADCLAAGQSALAAFGDKGAAPRVVQGCPATTTQPQVSASDLEQAKLHFSQALVLYQKDRNFPAAFSEFDRSYQLSKNPAVLYNLGLTLREMNRYEEAIVYLERYLAETPNIAPDLQKTTRQIIVDIRALLADVTLVVEPAGTKISIDGRAYGVAPLTKPVQLATGPHSIELAADGFEPQKHEIMTAAGVAAAFTYKLKEIPKFGEVTIIANVPGATIRVDGVFAGDSPAKVTLAGGGHTLEVVAPGYKPMRDELVVTAGTERTVNVELEKPVVVKNDRFYTKWYFWAPVGVIVAGAAIGITYAVTTAEDPIKGTLSPGIGSID